MTRAGFFTLLFCLFLAAAVSAQPPESPSAESGTVLAEGTVGYTGFGDEGLIHHAAFGGTVRGHVTPRISLAGELSYHIGPGQDRDVMVQGLAYVDFRTPRLGQAGRVEPYVLVGGGLLANSTGFGSASCLLLTWGGGTRVWVARRAYVTVDARLGWTPNIRVVSGVGILLR
jgi:hypothetical protein